MAALTVAVAASMFTSPAAVAAPAGGSTGGTSVGGPSATFPVPGGGTVSGPSPVEAPPADLEAGDVCPFPVHLQFPVNRQRALTYTDASGRVVAQYVQGALTGVITRTDTGRSVTRALDGRGLFTYLPNGATNLSGYGSALVGFHTGDTPAHRLLVFDAHGFSSTNIAADGTKTLLFGTGEDLCRTLA